MAPPDSPQPSFELLTYQIGELRSITEGGFAKLDGRIERVEGSVDRAETRITRLEVKQEATEKYGDKTWLPGNDLVKLIGAVVLVVLAAIGGNAAPPL